MRERVAFIDHGYHSQTLSSRFMIEHIGRTREVALHLDDSWMDKAAALDVEALAAGGYAEIHVWQLERVARRLAATDLPCPVFFYPMYDSCRTLGDEYWLALKGRILVVCFCRHLHERLRRLGLTSLWLQYWPEVAGEEAAHDALRVFWWRRRRDLAWETLKALIGDWPVARLHLHEAPDPTYPDPERLPPADAARFNLTRSGWFEDRAAFERMAAGFNVFVAPRRFEGIGLSFLEAMARGQVVIAENNPTMNEYIVHEVNGLLYEPDRPVLWRSALTPARAGAIGRRARLSCDAGRVRWQRDLARLDAYVRARGAVPEALLEPAGAAVRDWIAARA
jgi:hypothetical protein